MGAGEAETETDESLVFGDQPQGAPKTKLEVPFLSSQTLSYSNFNLVGGDGVRRRRRFFIKKENKQWVKKYIP